jgi:hypothetical protein
MEWLWWTRVEFSAYFCCFFLFVKFLAYLNFIPENTGGEERMRRILRVEINIWLAFILAISIFHLSISSIFVSNVSRFIFSRDQINDFLFRRRWLCERLMR